MCYYLLKRCLCLSGANCARAVIVLMVTCLKMGTGWSQIMYTASFTKILREAGLEYAVPAETWLHVTMPPDDDYMRYDLVLQNDRNDFEIRYRIQLHSGSDQEIPASIEVARLVASIASNDQETEIRIQIPPDTLLKEAFNAESGLIAFFTPKSDFSDKPYGAMISLYDTSRTSVNVVLLYTDPDYDPLRLYRNIRFRD